MDFLNKFFTPPPRAGLLKLLSLILVASTLTLLYTSCNKDEIKTSARALHDAKYDTYYKLKSFFEITEGKQPSHPALIPRSGYSADQAIGYIEGAMNLVYTDPGLTWKDYEQRIDTFELGLTSGSATQEAVDDLFEEIRDTASVHFYSITEPDRFPYLYDLINISATSTLLTLSVTSLVGKVHRNPTPFGENDYWTVITQKGLCTTDDDLDPPIDDAGSIEAKALNDYYTSYGGIFYTNTEHVQSLNHDENDESLLVGWGLLNPYDPTPGDFIIDYRTFKSFCTHNSQQCNDFFDEGGVYCMPPDGMNYYFQSIIGIFTAHEISSGLSVETLTGIDLVSRTESNMDIKSWECNVYFGTINYWASGNDFPYELPH